MAAKGADWPHEPQLRQQGPVAPAAMQVLCTVSLPLIARALPEPTFALAPIIIGIGISQFMLSLVSWMELAAARPEPLWLIRQPNAPYVSL